jgi:hypothetical protein
MSDVQIKLSALWAAVMLTYCWATSCPSTPATLSQGTSAESS